MKPKVIATLVFISVALVLRAQERPVPLDASATKKTAESDDAKRRESISRVSRGVALNKSGLVAQGPLVDAFLTAPRPSGELTLGQKILRLPILNIFVPAPMPKPTRQGKYFAWGERDAPWSAVVDRQLPGPQGVLVSVSK